MFGRQLVRGISSFGKQVGRVAQKVESGLGKAAQKLSGVEKITNYVPVVGSAVKAVDAGLKAGSALSGATSSILKGRPGEALSKGKNAVNYGRDTLASGSSALAQGIAFL
jgi:hypothetical protein